MIKANKREIRIAAAIVLDQYQRMLLVRKSGTKFFMQPGGKMESGETATSALQREVWEELGTELVSSDYVGTLSAPAANEPGYTVIAELFSVSLGSEPQPAAEIDELLWLDPENCDDLDIAPLSRLIVEQRGL